MGRNRILAVIPAYNEQDNIVSTIEDLRKCAPGIDYVVINDGSRDRTLDICKERGYSYVSLPVNLGLAGAFQTGMRYAYEHDYDYAIQFDADGQHSAAYIEEMVKSPSAPRPISLSAVVSLHRKSPYRPAWPAVC